MTRRDRHASPDDLASLSVGELRRRRAAKIEVHVSGCVECTAVRQQLDEIPALLAGTSYPAMPHSLTIRVETAIHAEARYRLADMPATEAQRGELPSRHRRREPRQGWHLPGLSGPVTRLVGALGAIVVIGLGSYEAVTHISGPSSTSAASGSAGEHATQQLHLGPSITYGRAGARQRSIHTYRSSINLEKASLATQADAELHAAKAPAASSSSPSSGSSAPQHFSAAAPSNAPSSALPAGLMGCVSLIAAGHTVTLVDLAHFEGKPATLIVIAAYGVTPAEAWVVGSHCSATVKDLLADVPLPHP